MLLGVNLAIDAARYVRALLQEARVLVDHATVNVHIHLLRAEKHVHVVHVLRRRVPGRRHHEHARAQRGVPCSDLFRRGAALPVDEGERHAECAGEQRVCVDGRSLIWSESVTVKDETNQSCKKIIDLDLKDRDHLIDLDLLGDLDHCW